jgi:hypothetical protein
MSLISWMDSIINRHLRDYERQLPLSDRLQLWHWWRVTHDTTPILWTLQFVWWIPGLRWLWRLRCSNVSWRMERHNRRMVAS